MSFRINTNISALNAHTIGVANNRSLHNSLEKLSSGLRLNKAADDASGMAIADSLRSQSEGLGQAVRNANDAIGIIQVADKAMDEQLKILDTIKTKAIQAAQDGQTTETRKALQSDILRLLEELDNIANTTSFNGQQMLSGAFSNKEFQIGAYSNTTIKASIGPTSSDKIGHIRMESSSFSAVGMLASGAARNLTEVMFNIKEVDGKNSFEIETVKISTSANTGIGVLSEVINKHSDKLGVRAAWSVMGTGSSPVLSGTVRGLVINGVTIGTVNDVRKNDSDGRLINAINSVKERTGTEAFIDITGRLNLRSTDGRGIQFSTTGAVAQQGQNQQAQGNGQTQQQAAGVLAIEKVNGGKDITAGPDVKNGGNWNLGRLSLVRTDARDIVISGAGISATGYNTDQTVAEATVNLRDVTGSFDKDIRSASGGNFNGVFIDESKNLGAGVTSLRGAMVTMDIAESATKILDKIRADLGSVQGQMVSTVNNITITQVNVKAAESQIREVDFAAESSEFSKLNILAQSGSYALSQANAVQQNILRLLN